MDKQSLCPIKVVVADANPDEREMCRILLANARRVDIVAELGRWEEVLANIHRYQPRVLLLQWSLGCWAAGAEDWLAVFRAVCPIMRVLVLARPGEKAAAQWAMVHGVRGVLTAESCPGELLSAVRYVAEKDEAWISRKELKSFLGKCTQLLRATGMKSL